MRYLTLNEVLELYHWVMEQSGGAVGIRDLNGLESAEASVNEQERAILQVASGEMRREAFTEWLRAHIVPGIWERRTD